MFPNPKPLKENKNEQVGPFGYYHCFKQKHLTPIKIEKQGDNKKHTENGKRNGKTL